MFCLQASLFAKYMPGPYGGQERVSDPLELECLS